MTLNDQRAPTASTGLQGTSADPTPLSRLAAVALLVAGASYIALLLMLAIVSRGHLPHSGQELLDYLARFGLLVQVAMVAFIVKDACILVAFPILATLLGGICRPSIWVATVIASLAMVLDILSGLIVIALRGFADAFALATPSANSAYVQIADLVFRYVWRVETPFIVALLSLAVILFSRQMPAGQFGRAIPRTGMIMGSVGICGALLGLIQPVLLLSLWYTAVGLKLLRATRQVTAAPSSS